MKQLIAQEIILAFPDWDKPFDVFTDSSDYQLGGVIQQGGKPLAFYSRKLNKAQKNYTIEEKELLGIVETLKEFKGMLLGYKINVYTDHLNLVHETTLKASDRVMRWKLLLEEFGIKTTHVKGEDNKVADAISRLTKECPEEAIEEPEDTVKTQESKPNITVVHPYYPEVMSPEILNLEEEEFPLSLEVIYRVQQACRATRKLSKEKGYKKVVIDTLPLVFTDKDQLVIPEAHQNEVLNWYHYFLKHPGETRMEQTIRAKLYWKDMTGDIKHFVKTCHVCKKFKKNRKKYGQLPLKDITQDMTP